MSLDLPDPAPKKFNTPSQPFRKERGMIGAHRFKTFGWINRFRPHPRVQRKPAFRLESPSGDGEKRRRE
jgi:hypothetical protein